MCATVNEPGKKYTWMAEGSEGNAFTPLSLAVSEALELIKQALAGRARAEKQGERPAIASKMFLDCVHKLEGLAYRLARLSALKTSLLQRIAAAPNRKWNAVAFLEANTVFEFEALVLQARATLDTVTWLLSRACGQRTWRFSRLRNVLSDGATSDKKIHQCLGLLDQCPWMLSSKVLVGDPSTRSYIAHYGSLLSTQRTCFTVNKIDSQRVLLIDAEMHDNVPVMTTASRIQQDVAFFAMAALSVFLDLPLPDKDLFASDLGREFVVLSESPPVSGKAVKIGVVKEMRSDGAVLADVTASDEILRKVVNLRHLSTAR